MAVLASYPGAEGGVINREFILNQVRERVWFKADADIDADGSNGQGGTKPAYMLNDAGSELLGDGGMMMRGGRVVPRSDWYKDIVIINPDGSIKVFDNGMIASKSAYKIPLLDSDDPEAYLCAETIPYIVVPEIIRAQTTGVALGCLARVTYHGMARDCMVGDVGPRYKLGELSIALARMFNINASPRSGGVEEKDFLYEIFPNQFFTFNGYTYPLQRTNGLYVQAAA